LDVYVNIILVFQNRVFSLKKVTFFRQCYLFLFKTKTHVKPLYEQVYMGLMNGYFCFFYPPVRCRG